MNASAGVGSKRLPPRPGFLPPPPPVQHIVLPSNGDVTVEEETVVRLKLPPPPPKQPPAPAQPPPPPVQSEKKDKMEIHPCKINGIGGAITQVRENGTGGGDHEDEEEEEEDSEEEWTYGSETEEEEEGEENEKVQKDTSPTVEEESSTSNHNGKSIEHKVSQVAVEREDETSKEIADNGLEGKIHGKDEVEEEEEEENSEEEESYWEDESEESCDDGDGSGKNVPVEEEVEVKVVHDNSVIEETGHDDDEEEEEEEDEEKENDEPEREDVGEVKSVAEAETSFATGAARKMSDVSEEGSSVESSSSNNRCKLASEEQLEDMLTRIKRLREERKKILDDMKAMKAAFADEQEEGHETAAATGGDADEEAEEGDSPRLLATSKEKDEEAPAVIAIKPVVNEHEDPQAEQRIRCFICRSDLGLKLNKGAAMHMGLQDGEPICPKALYLTEASTAKIRGVASSENLTSQEKYDLLRLCPLLASGDGSGTSGSEWAASADSFLEDMEARRLRDKEEQEAVRAGSISLRSSLQSSSVPTKEHSPALLSPRRVSTAERRRQQHSRRIPEEDDDQQLQLQQQQLQQQKEEGEEEEEQQQQDELQRSMLKEVRSRLLEEISSDSSRQRLSRAPQCDDRSEAAGRGKVLRTDLAPTVAVSSFRRVLRQISDEDGRRVKERLKRVPTSDRSAPFLPADMEIFCVGDRWGIDFFIHCLPY